jgi:hypothetical protein
MSFLKYLKKFSNIEETKKIEESIGLDIETFSKNIQDFVRSESLKGDHIESLVNALDKAIGLHDLRKIEQRIRVLRSIRS